jgi:hypothetical protein
LSLVEREAPCQVFVVRIEAAIFVAGGLTEKVNSMLSLERSAREKCFSIGSNPSRNVVSIEVERADIGDGTNQDAEK